MAPVFIFGPGPGGAMAPAFIFGPGPGGAMAPDFIFGPGPGGAVAPVFKTYFKLKFLNQKRTKSISLGYYMFK